MTGRLRSNRILPVSPDETQAHPDTRCAGHVDTVTGQPLCLMLYQPLWGHALPRPRPHHGPHTVGAVPELQRHRGQDTQPLQASQAGAYHGTVPRLNPRVLEGPQGGSDRPVAPYP